MKKLILLILLLFSFSQSFSQLKTPALQPQNLSVSASLRLEQKRLEVKKKSPGLALLYSLLVPGLGQIYTNRFDVGKYFIVSEASLWLGFASFTIYGNWLFNDAATYAVNHAGIKKDGKPDDFFVNIGNYDNVDQYNQDKLLHGQYDEIYYPGTGYDFYWDDVENRKKYRSDELASERIHNDRLFIAGAVLINHLISAVSAVILTNKHNSELIKGGGFSLTAGVTKHFRHIDGLKLQGILTF